MKKTHKLVGVIGHIEPDWIARQVRLEDNIAFAKSEHYVPQASPTPAGMELTPAAAYVLGRSISKFIHSCLP
jgi:hypothetical protein